MTVIATRRRCCRPPIRSRPRRFRRQGSARNERASACVTIAPPPSELELDRDHDYQRPNRYDARGPARPERNGQAATAFPEPVAIDPPETLRTAKQFGCSGDIESTRYREATRFRALPEMEWPDARIALRRRFVPVEYSGTSPEYVALAEFALSAAGYEGFVGRARRACGQTARRTFLGARAPAPSPDRDAAGRGTQNS